MTKSTKHIEMSATYYQTGCLNVAKALDFQEENLIPPAQMRVTAAQKTRDLQTYQEQNNLQAFRFTLKQPTAEDCDSIVLEKANETIYLSRTDPTGKDSRTGIYAKVMLDSFGRCNVCLVNWFIGTLNRKTGYYEWRLVPIQIIDRGENRLMPSGFTN